MIRNTKLYPQPDGSILIARKGSWEPASFSSSKAARFAMRFPAAFVRQIFLSKGNRPIHFRELFAQRANRF